MNSTTKYQVRKHLVYIVMFLLLYIIQMTPGLFAIGGIKPVCVFSAAIAVAMYEGELIGGLYGAGAGLLCDTASVGWCGFNGLLFCLFCTVVGLLVIYLMCCNLRNALLFVGVGLLLRGSIEFLFAYGIWGYDGVWRLYVFHTLPTILYSVAVTPLIYLLVRRLHRRFEMVLHP